MTDRLTIALAQLNPVMGDIPGNLAKARAARADAAKANADLILFTELFITAYPPEDLVLKPALQEDAREAIEKLANVEGIDFISTHLAKEAGARSTARFDVAVVYEQKIDIAAERERLQKELARIEAEMARLQKQLQNEQFLAKAPAKVIEGMRSRQSELEVLVVKVRDGLKVLGFGQE